MNKKELQCFLQYHIHSFIYLFIHSLLQTFIHSFIHSFTHSFTFWAAAPKGLMTYPFTQGSFLLLLLHYPHPPPPPGSYLSLEAQISILRPKSQPQDPNPILRPKSYLRGPNLSLKGFGPQDWDMGLEAEIWAWRLGEGDGGEEGENSPV